MSEIVFASPGQSIDAALLASSGDSATLDERIAAIERLNPSINGKKFTLGQFTPYIIPGPNVNEQMCGADFGAIKAEYTALPLDAKKSLDDLGADESLTLLQAVQQFKIDHLPQYDVGSATADTNTYGSGIVGAQLSRSVGVVSHMRYIEKLLNQYQLASGIEKAKLKTQINAAYKSLNSNFGTVLNKYVARAGRGTVRSAQQAIKNAGMNKPTNITNSAKVRPLLNAARGFKYVSKGMIFLDVGFRAYNVIHSKNRGRTFTSELFGFVGSYAAGYIGGLYAVSLALGPLGWIIAIIVIGAAVVTLDYLGKTFGHYAYNAGSNLYSNSILTLNY